MNFDQDQITQAIVDCDVSPMAKEEGARLVQAWLEGVREWRDTNWRSVLVEAPFYIKIDEKTLIVGAQDRIGSRRHRAGR